MVNISKKKILLAMSGGVDSSTAAAILKKQGSEAVGIFFHFWKNSYDQKTKRALTDVRKVCRKLNIPLKVVNARARFKKEVVDYFLREYAAGRTPNPCVICNEQVKFKLLLDEAKKIGADIAATGHYARIKISAKGGSAYGRKNTNQKSPPKTDQPLAEKLLYGLFSAKDLNKDQSYFLYRLKQEQLAKIIFPLGNYKKTEVRKMAKDFGLPVFDKKESQNVCFLADKEINPHTQLSNLPLGKYKKRLGVGVNNFLKRNIKIKNGRIMDTQGKFLGEHQGLFLYTLGQRKGINIGGDGPYWVVGKDEKENILRVTNQKKHAELYSREMSVGEVNWISGAPKLPAKVLVKTRYRQPSVYAIINKDQESGVRNQGVYRIKFKKPVRAVCPGQSAVFYSKAGEVMGGGIIK